VLTVVKEDGSAREDAAARPSLIDEIVREGARRMLAAALEAEVAGYVGQVADERDEAGRRLVMRNGRAEPRQVLTSAGAIDMHAPRINDKRIDEVTGERKRFCSAILPAWCRRSPKITDVLPLLYLHGLSGRDFVPALEQFLGSSAGLSAATITRLTEQWQDECEAFSRRDLSAVDYVHVWAYGLHVNIRLEEHKLCLLVVIGVRADGSKELLALADGYRESVESWADLLRDAKRRGCGPRCSPSETAHSGSGVGCAKCSRTPPSSDAGSTNRRMSLPRCRNQLIWARRRRSPRSGQPRTRPTPWLR
jgi:putative transposase